VRESREKGGEAVQVDPMKPKMKPPGTKRLKLKWEILLSISAFKFNLRRYRAVRMLRLRRAGRAGGRGLHSSTSQLNLSRF